MKPYLDYWANMIQYCFKGGKLYWAWLSLLGVMLLLGAISYYHHLVHGLILTNMSDQVPWGIGVANFTFMVGVAASPVLLAVPAYIYKNKEIKEVSLIGQLMAFSAVLMSLLFIFTDIGRPDRFIHLVPGLGGRMNFPNSMLAWDVVVINVYLVLSLHIPGYLLYMMYLGKKPRAAVYLPFVFIAIFWALALHTVTAFLLLGLGSRSFWNQAILEPRFLISAFASGPAIMILVFAIINKTTRLQISPKVFEYLKYVLRIMLPIDLSLVGCEIFKEFYTNSVHAISTRYLYFGLHGHHKLTPFIWSAIVFNMASTVVYFTPKFRNNSYVLYTACVLTTIGIWIEKGMGLIFPAFIPTPLGEVVEYFPNGAELLVCGGVLSLGLLLFTLMSKVAIGIQTGELVASKDD